MKPDYRELIAKHKDKVPVFDFAGNPSFYSVDVIKKMYKKNEIKIIVCQHCLMPFFVFPSFCGDPPPHNMYDCYEQGHSDCLGGTMLSMGEGDIGCLYSGIVLLDQESFDRAVIWLFEEYENKRLLETDA